MITCGKDFSFEAIDMIRDIIAENQQISRTQLSRQVCEKLNWCNPNGLLKEMSCRVALLRLNRKGILNLPQAYERPCFNTVKDDDDNKLKIFAIIAEETNVPSGVEGLKRILLTTCEVGTFEQAVEKLQWYCIRWGIEIYHRTLKSGCKIEMRQLDSADRIESSLAIDMIVAWRIYHLTKLGREVPDVPCTVFFEDAERKALVAYKTKNPILSEEPLTLRETIHMVASLGQPGTQFSPLI
jgi:hypothetical protein